MSTYTAANLVNFVYVNFISPFQVQFGSTDAESKSESPADTATAVTGSQYKELVVNLESGLLTICMNRPAKYNAITWEVLHGWEYSCLI